MQYVPNKLEQYAESVILAVSTEHDILYIHKLLCAFEFCMSKMSGHGCELFSTTGPFAVFIRLLHISPVLYVLPGETW